MEKIIKTAWFFVVLISLSLSVFLAIGSKSAYAANTSSLNFDGTNDYVRIPDSVSLHVGNAVTVEAWIKPGKVNGDTGGEATGGRLPIFSTRTATSTPAGSWQIEVGNVSNTSKWGRVIVGSPGAINAETANDVIVSNVWQHVAFTKAGASGPQSIYVNGISQTLTTDSVRTWADNTDDKRIGRNGNFLGIYLGFIGEVRLYNYARTQGQIARDMKGEVDLNDGGLVGYWKFDENGGCAMRDYSSYANNGLLGATCAGTDNPSWSTDHPGYGADLPRTFNPTIKRGGDAKGILWQDSAVAESGYTVKRVEYSANGGDWQMAAPTDGNKAYDTNTEPYEFSFSPWDNNPNYPGFVVEVKHIDSADRVGKRLYFEPFELKAIRTLSDDNLEVEFSVNQQRSLLKDRLDKYVILYAQEGQEEKQLAADIPADFEQVRSSTQNIATLGQQQPSDCDPCFYEDNTMKIRYAQNNSSITLTTKKGFSPPSGKYYFKIRSYNKDNNFFETQKIYPTEDKVTSSTDQLTSTSQSSAKPEETTIEEQSQNKLPGQKTTFETPSGAQTGPIAAVLNTIVDLIAKIVNSVTNLVKG